MNYEIILKKIREERELTQNEISKILNISRVTYNHYEVQESIIPLKHLETLSNYYKVSIDYLLGLSKNTYDNTSYRNIDINLFATRLKNLRKEKGITQGKIAKLVNTSQSTIAGYEKKRNLLPVHSLYTICSKYKVSADYLLGRIDNPKELK